MILNNLIFFGMIIIPLVLLYKIIVEWIKRH